MMTTPATLTLIRDESVSVAALARRFGQSEMFAAGLIDAATGTGEFLDCIDWCEESASARQDYRDGFRHAQELVDAENYADGWDEAYALASAVQPEFLPVTD